MGNLQQKLRHSNGEKAVAKLLNFGEQQKICLIERPVIYIVLDGRQCKNHLLKIDDFNKFASKELIMELKI
jgi:hypothetical protein